MKKLRKANVEEVIALHGNGRRTLQEVGDIVGVSRERVRQILARHKVKRRKGRSYLESQSPDWLKAHQHLTITEAATQLGCAQSTISEWSRYYGIKMKSARTGHPPSRLDDAYIYSLASDPRPLWKIGLEVSMTPSGISRQMIRIGIGRGPRWKRGAPFCWRGHPFNKENTYTKAGKRWCRACGRIRNKKPQRRLKMQREASTLTMK